MSKHADIQAMTAAQLVRLAYDLGRLRRPGSVERYHAVEAAAARLDRRSERGAAGGTADNGRQKG